MKFWEHNLWGNEILKENIQLAGIGMFVATLPFYREVNQIFYVIFLLSCIPLISRQLWAERKQMIFAFTAIYLVAIFSSVYAPDLKAAYSRLEIQLALLLSPVVLGISYVPSPQKNKLVKLCFMAGVSVALLVLLFAFLYKIYSEKLSLPAALQLQNLNHQYAAPISIHATFFSTYITVCVTFILQFLESAKALLWKLLLFFLLILCVVSLFLLLSRVVLVVFGVCFLVYFFFLKRSLLTGKLLIGICVLIILIIFVRQSSYFKERFDHDLQKDLKWNEWAILLSNTDTASKENILANDGARIERWVAAVRLIKQKPLLGFGTGQEKPALYRKYQQMGLTVTLEKGYDAHNQILSVMIQSGLPGLLAFLMLFIVSFYTSIANKDFAYLCFLLVVVAVALTDNYFGPNKGIFFFSFFNAFFAISCINKNRLKE